MKIKRRTIDYISLIILFTFAYIILNENITFLIVGLGIISGVVAIWLTNIILEIDYVEMFHINLKIILVYFWIILRDTYVVGFDTLKRIIKNDINPNYITLETKLEDEFLIMLFANAITMPPGAITVDRIGKKMTILTVGFEPEQFIKDTEKQIERLFVQFDTELESGDE